MRGDVEDVFALGLGGGWRDSGCMHAGRGAGGRSTYGVVVEGSGSDSEMGAYVHKDEVQHRGISYPGGDQVTIIYSVDAFCTMIFIFWVSKCLLGDSTTLNLLIPSAILLNASS